MEGKIEFASEKMVKSASILYSLSSHGSALVPCVNKNTGFYGRKRVIEHHVWGDQYLGAKPNFFRQTKRLIGFVRESIPMSDDKKSGKALPGIDVTLGRPAPMEKAWFTTSDIVPRAVRKGLSEQIQHNAYSQRIVMRRLFPILMFEEEDGKEVYIDGDHCSAEERMVAVALFTGPEKEKFMIVPIPEREMDNYAYPLTGYLYNRRLCQHWSYDEYRDKK